MKLDGARMIWCRDRLSPPIKRKLDPKIKADLKAFDLKIKLIDNADDFKKGIRELR